MRPYLIVGFLLLALLIHRADAQYGINLSLPRTTYLGLEAIAATVTIANRSGAELVLGGPGRRSWLSFEMTDSNGRQLSPIEVSGAELVQLAAGQTIQKKVIVTDAYAPTDIGNYSLTARVYHPPTDQFYNSNRVRFSITDVKPLWEQSYGVPKGFQNAGVVQRYVLSVLQEMSSSSLYFRLIDDKSGIKLRTYPLGPVSLARDPQITVDRGNRLQVLFMVMPQMYAYCIVKPDGELEKRSYYREKENSRPRLLTDPEGNSHIDGGEYYDPTAVPPPSERKSRGVSERPPGL